MTLSSSSLRDQAKDMLDRLRPDEDKIRVLWLSFTLFFTVGGYWLLRSIKDPIISIIDGVRTMLHYFE
jgi:hypothetical protein